jgi:FPC/CPF motif-containing protein YcgG
MNNPYHPTEYERSFIDLKRYTKNHQFVDELRPVQEFKKFVTSDTYSCIGAKSSANSRNICFGIYDSFHSEDTTLNLAWGLIEYIKALIERKSLYLSYVAMFPNARFSNEEEFEHSMWQLLKNLHTLDSQHFKWDPEVSKDPDNLKFSYSFGQRAFFVVGLHPESSRKARQFKIPTLAFNLHSQFEGLRSRGRFETMKMAIRENELKLQGSINPMLADYGEGFEARQYSGRKVNSSWECPFKDLI